MQLTEFGGFILGLALWCLGFVMAIGIMGGCATVQDFEYRPPTPGPCEVTYVQRDSGGDAHGIGCISRTEVEELLERRAEVSEVVKPYYQ